MITDNNRLATVAMTITKKLFPGHNNFRVKTGSGHILLGRTSLIWINWLDTVEVYVCVDLPAMPTYWDCALSSVVGICGATSIYQ